VNLGQAIRAMLDGRTVIDRYGKDIVFTGCEFLIRVDEESHIIWTPKNWSAPFKVRSKRFEKMKPIERIKTSDQLPPKGVTVIVAGGPAMLKTGGEWFSGIEEPMFTRTLQCTPEWWAYFPTDNDPMG
jgi:hypothetical protein